MINTGLETIQLYDLAPTKYSEIYWLDHLLFPVRTPQCQSNQYIVRFEFNGLNWVSCVIYHLLSFVAVVYLEAPQVFSIFLCCVLVNLDLFNWYLLDLICYPVWLFFLTNHPWGSTCFVKYFSATPVKVIFCKLSCFNHCQSHVILFHISHTLERRKFGPSLMKFTICRDTSTFCLVDIVY